VLFSSHFGHHKPGGKTSSQTLSDFRSNARHAKPLLNVDGISKPRQ